MGEGWARVVAGHPSPFINDVYRIVATSRSGGAASPRDRGRARPSRPDHGLEISMQHVRPIAGRVLRFVFNRWLKEAAKIHYL
jgi:hypothetical protein